MAEYLVDEGVVEDISHEGLRAILREQGVSFQRTFWRDEEHALAIAAEMAAFRPPEDMLRAGDLKALAGGLLGTPPPGPCGRAMAPRPVGHQLRVSAPETCAPAARRSGATVKSFLVVYG